MKYEVGCFYQDTNDGDIIKIIKIEDDEYHVQPINKKFIILKYCHMDIIHGIEFIKEFYTRKLTEDEMIVYSI